MKINLILLFYTICVFSPKDSFITKYVYKDDYRYLEMELRSDSSMLFGNSSRDLFRTYRMNGKWEIIDEHTLLVNCPLLDSALVKNYQMKSNEIKPEEIIDWGKAHKDRSLVFPYMINDTLRFFKRYKNLMIHGFEFKRMK